MSLGRTTRRLVQTASYSSANLSLPPPREKAELLSSFLILSIFQRAYIYIYVILQREARSLTRHFSAHFCRRCELFETCPWYNRVTVCRQWPRPLGTHRWLQLCEFSTSAPPPPAPAITRPSVLSPFRVDACFCTGDWSSTKFYDPQNF